MAGLGLSVRELSEAYRTGSVPIDVKILEGETTPFDRLTALACSLMDAPIAMVSLFRDDMSVFRSNGSFHAKQVPRAQSIAPLMDEVGPNGVLIVEDTLLHPSLNSHVLSRGPDALSFYAGVPLVNAQGRIVGGFGVTDRKPRPAPSPEQMEQLRLLTGMVTTIIDQEVYGRKQAEQVRLLGLAEKMSGVGHWRYDVKVGQIIWSDEVYRIHGLDPAAFDPSEENVIDLYRPVDRNRLRAMVHNAMTTGEGYNYTVAIDRADGCERIVCADALTECDADGEVVTLFGVFQDVTEQHNSISEITESEARYRFLADNMGDVILRTRLDGTVSYMSPAVQSMLGWTLDEMAVRPGRSFVHPDDLPALTALIESGAEGDEGHKLEYRLLHKDGHFVWAEGHFKAVCDPCGTVREIVVVIRDVSKRKALEAELIEARDRAEAGARAKSEFLANMSHELRTPLTSVIGFSGLLQDSTALGAVERRHVDRIATSSRALLDVINDILDYSKLEADSVDLDPIAFDPRDLARKAADILEPQCDTKRVSMDVEIGADVPARLMGDEARLRQVLLNLLSNAVKFTSRGSVKLTLAREVASDGSDMLRVSVRDTGIGITPEMADTLFERFSQADASTTRVYGGTGLGLAISKRLIELMGGRIGAEGRVGEGSTFWFTVPLTVAVEIQVADIAVEALIPDSARVLVADDAAANRELIAALLGSLGLDVDLVCNGAEAVDAVRTGHYDLVLMDVQMPVMDGLMATETIRRLPGAKATTPILALTANVQSEQVKRCLQAGMDGHLAKPIQIPELARMLALWLQPEPEHKACVAA